LAGPSNADHVTHRHLIEVAIALRPLRVVGESRSRLVVEETQIVLHQARGQALDAISDGFRHPDIIERVGGMDVVSVQPVG